MISPEGEPSVIKKRKGGHKQCQKENTETEGVTQRDVYICIYMYILCIYSQSQCKFGKLMFKLTSIFPPLSLSGSSTYSSFTLRWTEQRKRRLDEPKLKRKESQRESVFSSHMSLICHFNSWGFIFFPNWKESAFVYLCHCNFLLVTSPTPSHPLLQAVDACTKLISCIKKKKKNCVHWLQHEQSRTQS